MSRLLPGFTPPNRNYAALVADILAHPFDRSVIGTDSGGYDVYRLEFGDPSKPTMFLSCAVHGSERGAAELGLEFGRRWAIDDDPAFRWLRQNWHIVILPCCSPLGFNVPRYTNANGVNLNRNFDNNWAAYSPGADPNNQKGSAPFSEPETQLIRDAFLSVKPLLAIDIHTNLAVQGFDVGKVFTRYRTLLQGVYDTTRALLPDDAFLEYSVGTSPTASGWYSTQTSKNGCPTIGSILEPDATPANAVDGMAFGLTTLWLSAVAADRMFREGLQARWVDA